MKRCIDTGLLRRYRPNLGLKVYRVLGSRPIKRDLIHGGRGFFAGTGSGIVTVAGQAAARRVVAIDRETWRPIRSVWSDADGRYRLNHLNPERPYIVMAVDHKRQYEPAIWDWVYPAVADDNDTP